MIKVLVAGAAGRMGSTVVQAVNEAEGLELVARVDPAFDDPSAFRDVASAIAATHPDVAVDFTEPGIGYDNTRAFLSAGVHAVVGTTGFTQDQLADLTALADTGAANCLIAPNFAIGAILMMRFAQEASRHLPKAEIIELHHDGKLDAPSGTAARTAALMDGDVPIHSVRLPGLVAHQEVILGGHGETLTIRHDSIARESFMPGVVLAVRRIGNAPGMTIGLESFLFETSTPTH